MRNEKITQRFIHNQPTKQRLMREDQNKREQIGLKILSIKTAKIRQF